MKELSEIAKATILLCCSVGLKNLPYNPLTSIQWYELGTKIVNSTYKTPDKLFGETVSDLVKNLSITQEQAERIHGLLSRSYSLAFALQELEQRGISLITKSDEEYPGRLRQVLGQRLVPPVLYYCGDLRLAATPGIAIVGSRNIDGPGTECALELARTAAEHQLTVFSGGARGVDSISREGALAAGGNVVEFVADSMLKKLNTKEYRKAIMDGRLLLLSAVKPTAGFSVASAMNRNKYVYALSHRAFVIASEKKKGGTWAGATESINKKYVPVSVWKHATYSGNEELAKLGAEYFDEIQNINFDQLEEKAPTVPFEEQSLFSMVLDNSESYSSKESPSLEVIPKEETSPDIKATIFDLVLPILLDFFKKEHTLEEASEKLDLEKKQLTSWLERAEAMGLVTKKLRPKRYITKNK